MCDPLYQHIENPETTLKSRNNLFQGFTSVLFHIVRAAFKTKVWCKNEKCSFYQVSHSRTHMRPTVGCIFSCNETLGWGFRTAGHWTWRFMFTCVASRQFIVLHGVTSDALCYSTNSELTGMLYCCTVHNGILSQMMIIITIFVFFLCIAHFFFPGNWVHTLSTGVKGQQQLTTIIVINWHFLKNAQLTKISTKSPMVTRKPNLHYRLYRKASINVWDSPGTQMNDTAQMTVTECSKRLLRVWRTLRDQMWLSMRSGHQRLVVLSLSQPTTTWDEDSRHTEPGQILGRNTTKSNNQ